MAIHSLIITVIYLAVGVDLQNFRRGWGETHNFYYPVKRKTQYYPRKTRVSQKNPLGWVILIKPGFLPTSKNYVQKSNLLPKIAVAVGQCEFRYNIVNFDKKSCVPKEIPSEVKVSVVQMIVIMRDDCISKYLIFLFKTQLFNMLPLTQ